MLHKLNVCRLDWKSCPDFFGNIISTTVTIIYIYIYALKLKQTNLHKEWYVDSGWFSVCVPFIYQHSKNASKVKPSFEVVQVLQVLRATSASG